MWICAKCQAVNVSKEPRCRICGALPGDDSNVITSAVPIPADEVPAEIEKQMSVRPTAIETLHGEEAAEPEKEEQLNPMNVNASKPEPSSAADIPETVPDLIEVPEIIPAVVDIPDSLIPGNVSSESSKPKEESRPSLTARIPGSPPGKRVGPIASYQPAQSSRQNRIEELEKTSPAYVTYRNQSAPKVSQVSAVNTSQANGFRPSAPPQDSYSRTAPIYSNQRPDNYHATEPVGGGFAGNISPVKQNAGKKPKTGLIVGVIAIAVVLAVVAALLLRVTHQVTVLENIPCTLDESVRLGKVINTEFFDETGKQASEVTIQDGAVTALVPNGSGSAEYTVVNGAVTEVRNLDGSGRASSTVAYQEGTRVETELNTAGEALHVETYDSTGELLSEQNLLEDGSVQHLNYKRGLVASETVVDQNGKRLYEITYEYSGQTLIRKERYENDQLVLEEEYNDDGVIKNAVYYANGLVTRTEQYDEDGDLEHSEETVYDANGNRVKKITYDAWLPCYSTGDYYYSGSWGVPVYKPYSEVLNCTSFMLAFKYTMVNSNWLGRHIVFARVNNSWTTVGEIYINDLNTWYTIEYETQKPAKVDGIALRPATASTESYSLSYVFGDVVCETSY